MSRPLKLILLVDDDEATNFLHKIIIRDSGIADETHVVKNGQEAIDYLIAAGNNQLPKPDLIFLDINMPVMNGWEFLEEYRKLSDEQKPASTVLIMLTTSINPDDVLKANSYAEVTGFKNKPISVTMLKNIVADYFSDRIKDTSA